MFTSLIYTKQRGRGRNKGKKGKEKTNSRKNTNHWMQYG